MSAILRCQAKNRFYESTQRLIQPRRVLWSELPTNAKGDFDSGLAAAQQQNWELAIRHFKVAQSKA
ncbi:MAG: hypothetical protein ACREUP_08305, partial [Burkholderiales bacterium]